MMHPSPHKHIMQRAKLQFPMWIVVSCIAACMWLYTRNARHLSTSGHATQMRSDNRADLSGSRANPHVCIAVVSGNRTNFLFETLTATLRHLQQDEPRISFELVLVDNGTREQAFNDVVSKVRIDQIARVHGAIGPHAAHGLVFLNLCHAPFVLSLEDDFAYRKMSSGNTNQPISRALDVLRYDPTVAMVDMRYSTPAGREWSMFQEASEDWMATKNGTLYKRTRKIPDDWGALPYGGLIFRRDAFATAANVESGDNSDKSMGDAWSAIVQLQACESPSTSHRKCAEEMTKAFCSYAGDTRFNHDTIGRKSTNPLLTRPSCDPDFDIKIFVYDMPARFGADALTDHATRCNSTGVCYWHSCLTGAFSLESRLHSMLLKSPHRTMNPDQADMFFVPLYLICNLLAPSRVDSYEAKYLAEMLADAAAWLNSTGPWFSRYAGEDHIWPFARDFGAHQAMVLLKQGIPIGPDALVNGPALNRELGKLVRNGVFVGHFGVTPGSKWPGASTYRRGRDIVVPTITYNAQIVEVERHCMQAHSRAEKKRCVENELVPQLVYAEANVTDVYMTDSALIVALEMTFTRPFPKSRGVRFSLDLQQAASNCQHGPFLGAHDKEVLLSPDVLERIKVCSVENPVRIKTNVTIEGIDVHNLNLENHDVNVFVNARCLNCSQHTPIFLRGVHGLDERAKVAVLSIQKPPSVHVKDRPRLDSYVEDPGRYMAVFGGSTSDRQYVMFRRKTGAISANGTEEVDVDLAHYSNGLRARMFPKWSNDPLISAFTHEQSRIGCTSYLQQLSNARFAIHAAGWSPWTQRFHESLATATIPVVVSPDYEFPYEELIDHSKYTIKLSNETEIANLGAFLSSVPKDVIASKAAHLPYALALQTWEDDRDEPEVCNAFRLFLVSASRRARKFKNGIRSSWV